MNKQLLLAGAGLIAGYYVLKNSGGNEKVSPVTTERIMHVRGVPEDSAPSKGVNINIPSPNFTGAGQQEAYFSKKSNGSVRVPSSEEMSSYEKGSYHADTGVYISKKGQGYSVAPENLNNLKQQLGETTNATQRQEQVVIKKTTRQKPIGYWNQPQEYTPPKFTIWNP